MPLPKRVKIKLEKYRLSKSLEVSRVINGLWQIADMEKGGVLLDPVTTSTKMEPYVEAGFTTFDMADHYGSAEIIAGNFKRNNPLGKKSTMLTKWVPKPGKISKDVVRKAVQQSLERLQTEKIDLLQFHAWKFSDLYWLDAMFWLQELKSEGLIGNIGVTNFDTAHLRVARASGIEIVSNQVSYSLFDQRGGGKLADYCQEEGIGIFAYGTLLGGFISNKWLGQPEPTGAGLTNMSLMKYKRFIDLAGGWSLFQEVLREINEVAIEADRSISIVASKYMLLQKAVAAVIIGARLGENNHLADSASLFTFDLLVEQCNRIKIAIAKLTPIPGDCGDEYRKPPYLTATGDLADHLENFPPMYEPNQVSPIRQNIDSGTVWEGFAGYSRAVRIGNRVITSGTTATHRDLVIGGGDPAAQAHFIIDKIEASLESLGAKLTDVVRTRIFVSDTNNAIAISRAHGERFGDIRPANTLVEAKLIGEEYLVEIEAEAFLEG